MDPNLPATSAPISSPERWAHLRFSVVGPLLASPSTRGQLRERLRALADQSWRHPISGQWVHFGVSTIERWYYRALRAKQDPVGALRRQVREDAGRFTAMSCALGEKLVTQYRAHPQWSYQLQADNLAAIVMKEPALGLCPGYACVRRFLKAQGLFPRPRRGPVHSPGAQAAEARFAAREIRSYQSEQVNALWHLDFHHGKVRVLLADGQWGYPLLLGVLDDCSRLCCHLQWYLHEGAEELCHGLSQALLKRALPRALMTDYVPRHIIGVLCPTALCGRDRLLHSAGTTIRPHNKSSPPRGISHSLKGKRRSYDRKILQKTSNLGPYSSQLALRADRTLYRLAE